MYERFYCSTYVILYESTNRNLLEVFSLLSTSNCYYSNGFRAR